MKKLSKDREIEIFSEGFEGSKKATKDYATSAKEEVTENFEKFIRNTIDKYGAELENETYIKLGILKISKDAEGNVSAKIKL